VIALIAAHGALHLAQQRIHFRHGKIPVCAHGAVTRHRAEHFVQRLFDAAGRAVGRQVGAHSTDQLIQIHRRKECGNCADLHARRTGADDVESGARQRRRMLLEQIRLGRRH
jgi:hypothetical protein